MQPVHHARTSSAPASASVIAAPSGRFQPAKKILKHILLLCVTAVGTTAYVYLLDELAASRQAAGYPSIPKVVIVAKRLTPEQRRDDVLAEKLATQNTLSRAAIIEE